MKHFLYQMVIGLGLISCLDPSGSPDPGFNFDGTGYRPIYVADEEMHDISVSGPVGLSDPGKIYLLGSWLFVNEQAKGIHIIDNSDPKNPENKAFVHILGNYDIAAKGTFLYADNGADMVVLDISNPRDVKVVRRISDALPVNQFPSVQNVYFECVNRKNGTVIGWEKVAMASKPECFR